MAYTRVNWEDLPSTDTPINATNLNIMDVGIYNNSQNISELKNKESIAYSGINIDDFKQWLINTAKSGVYLVDVGLSGAISCAIVQKANINYLSFIHFGYGVNAKQYRYLNGTWYEQSL